jgi:hypothetical protein
LLGVFCLILLLIKRRLKSLPKTLNPPGGVLEKKDTQSCFRLDLILFRLELTPWYRRGDMLTPLDDTDPTQGIGQNPVQALLLAPTPAQEVVLTPGLVFRPIIGAHPITGVYPTVAQSRHMDMAAKRSTLKTGQNLRCTPLSTDREELPLKCRTGVQTVPALPEGPIL